MPNWSSLRTILPLVGLAVLWFLAPHLGEYAQQILFRLILAWVLAESWNLLAGRVGLVTLGTSSAVGLGGYVTVALLNAWASAGHWGIPVALLTSAAAGALLAVVASPGLLRLRGLYFTVGTLALAELLRLLMINSDRFGGATGLFLNGDAPELMHLIHIALVLLLLTLMVWHLASRGRWSVSMRAVRDDEDVAMQMGVNPFAVKLGAFAAVSALMSMAGGLQALKLGAIEPYGMFGLRWSIDALCMAIIGGLGSRIGALLGAVVLTASAELLADYPEAHLALTGALLIVVMRFAPKGLAGLLPTRWRG